MKQEKSELYQPHGVSLLTSSNVTETTLTVPLGLKNIIYDRLSDHLSSAVQSRNFIQSHFSYLLVWFGFQPVLCVLWDKITGA